MTKLKLQKSLDKENQVEAKTQTRSQNPQSFHSFLWRLFNLFHATTSTREGVQKKMIRFGVGSYVCALFKHQELYKTFLSLFIFFGCFFSPKFWNWSLQLFRLNWGAPLPVERECYAVIVDTFFKGVKILWINVYSKKPSFHGKKWKNKKDIQKTSIITKRSNDWCPQRSIKPHQLPNFIKGPLNFMKNHIISLASITTPNSKEISMPRDLSLLQKMNS